MKRIFIPIAILVIVAVALIIARETRETVALVSGINPFLGQVFLWLLLVIYSICIMLPIITFLRLPKGLLPPSSENSAARDAYLEKLAKRLRKNKNLTHAEVTPATVQGALQELAQLSRRRTVEAATAIFVSTAVSQSGRLDGLMVLVTQSRLVWQIAHLYWQRPALGDLLSLYGNVAAAAFVAQNVEDIDVGELIEPVIAPVLANSVVAAIPGFAQVANLVASSCVNGTINAFLTLRIGCLASGYCGSVTKPSPRSLRRTAAAQAAGMLGSVAKDGAQRVGLAIWDAAKDTKVGGAASALANAAVGTVEQVSAAAMNVTQSSGARVATQFLVQIVADGATRTSNAIAEVVSLKRWRG